MARFARPFEPPAKRPPLRAGLRAEVGTLRSEVALLQEENARMASQNREFLELVHGLMEDRRAGGDGLALPSLCDGSDDAADRSSRADASELSRCARRLRVVQAVLRKAVRCACVGAAPRLARERTGWGAAAALAEELTAVSRDWAGEARQVEVTRWTLGMLARWVSRPVARAWRRWLHADRRRRRRRAVAAAARLAALRAWRRGACFAAAAADAARSRAAALSRHLRKCLARWAARRRRGTLARVARCSRAAPRASRSTRPTPPPSRPRSAPSTGARGSSTGARGTASRRGGGRARSGRWAAWARAGAAGRRRGLGPGALAPGAAPARVARVGRGAARAPALRRRLAVAAPARGLAALGRRVPTGPGLGGRGAGPRARRRGAGPRGRGGGETRGRVARRCARWSRGRLARACGAGPRWVRAARSEDLLDRDVAAATAVARRCAVAWSRARARPCAAGSPRLRAAAPPPAARRRALAPQARGAGVPPLARGRARRRRAGRGGAALRDARAAQVVAALGRRVVGSRRRRLEGVGGARGAGTAARAASRGSRRAAAPRGVGRARFRAWADAAAGAVARRAPAPHDARDAALARPLAAPRDRRRVGDVARRRGAVPTPRRRVLETVVSLGRALLRKWRTFSLARGFRGWAAETLRRQRLDWASSSARRRSSRQRKGRLVTSRAAAFEAKRSRPKLTWLETFVCGHARRSAALARLVSADAPAAARSAPGAASVADDRRAPAAPRGASPRSRTGGTRSARSADSSASARRRRRAPRRGRRRRGRAAAGVARGDALRDLCARGAPDEPDDRRRGRLRADEPDDRRRGGFDSEDPESSSESDAGSDAAPDGIVRVAMADGGCGYLITALPPRGRLFRDPACTGEIFVEGFAGQIIYFRLDDPGDDDGSPCAFTYKMMSEDGEFSEDLVAEIRAPPLQAVA
ncbi:hypothetical protein JL722_6443 [Aureococcus anophagefferens]|nr:hypothetical protein JL722_6443 [Aureococcus anophagefferens]